MDLTDLERKVVEAAVASRLAEKALAEFHVMYDPPLDPGIQAYVEVLNSAGVETYESCEGGPEHAYPEPTISFHGDASEGFRALSVARQHGLPVAALRRAWHVIDGEPVGPQWEMTFSRRAGAGEHGGGVTCLDASRRIHGGGCACG